MCDIEDNHFTVAAILEHDDVVWAQSSNFPQDKDLKQQLKLISTSRDDDDGGDERSKKRPRFSDDQIDKEGKEVTKEMKDFVLLLDGEIKKFNGFFIDKEEEYIIRFKLLFSTAD